VERQNSEDSYNLILGGKPNLIRESRILSEFDFIPFYIIYEKTESRLFGS